MGLGTSKLKEELEASQKELSEWRARAESLGSEATALQDKLLLREREAADAAQRCEQRLDASREELEKAVKHRQIAEEMRRSDALLVKRVTSMLVRQQKAASGEAGSTEGGSGYLAAELARAIGDEQMLRRVCLARAHPPAPLILFAAFVVDRLLLHCLASGRRC